MEEYIFALIAFVLLLPVLLFLPGAMTRKGKVWIAGGGLLISLLGLLASNQYPLGLVAIILFILVIVSSVMIGNRFGPLLLAEEGVQDRNNSAEADTAADRPEKVLFTAVEEESGSAESTLEEPEAAQEEAPAESETRVEFINEDLEEIPLLIENDSTAYDIKEEAAGPETEAVAAQYSEEKEENILEEVSFQPSTDDELSEIEMLISQEEGERPEPLHNTNQDEAVVEAEEPLEELSDNSTIENWDTVSVEEDNEELSEIELLIELSDESEPAEEELLESDIEHSTDAQTETEIEEAEVTTEELDLGELTEIEAQFLMPSPSDEDDSEMEVLSPMEESIVEIEEPEEPVLAEGLLEVEAADDEIRSDESDILISRDSTEVLEEQEEELQPVLQSDLSYDAEMMILPADSHQENADESIEEETQQEQEPQGNAQLQTLIIHTIAEELAYYRNKMSLEEFEALAAQYMQPELHDRDFYVLSQQLIQRYHESQEFKKMKAFIEGMEERFMTYPLLKSELNDYKEMAWKNIIKQELLNRRE
ncbi:hypothetical protein ACQCVP_21405 [Rossellomorea vietnamensis]|uniref:hypothetical protein n=1 Tax=Rossellomorea vietnamensis TaxID=218284 RepID=UPI003CF44AA5